MMYGHHELYNLSRLELGKKHFLIPFVCEATNSELLVGYTTIMFYTSHSGTMMMTSSILGNCASLYLTHTIYMMSLGSLCQNFSKAIGSTWNNTKQIQPNYPEQEKSPEGLEGLSRRFIAFNGGVDTPQLEWFKTSMQSARENVIICSH